ncbi:MAG: hypothetical protein WC699_17265 [Bacteroidales bacterium]|jgi:hypothetical protein
MKKQFLLIALALCAGVMVYGQNALHNSIPRPISCLDDAGHPIAGKPYVYEASGTPAGGQFLFWATKDPNFIASSGTPVVTTNNLSTRLTTPTDLITTSANYGVAGAATQVSITWSDATLNGTVPGTTPTFVAAHYTAPVAGCADNFNAWEIQPIKAFIVDVKNIEDGTKTILAYDAAEDQCADIVRSATYAAGTVNYDFGTNTLYYEVIAANFSGSWTPTLAVVGLDVVEAAVITWTYELPSTWSATTVWNAATAPVTPDATVLDVSLGVSIYVKVVITHNNYEGIAVAGRDITLQVDGQNAAGDWDIANNLANGSPSGTCTPAAGADQMDIALQNIKARPVIAPITPATFLPDNKKN